MEQSMSQNLAIFYKIYSKADFNIQNYIIKYHDMTKKPIKKTKRK
jgi:hypothetical protein